MPHALENGPQARRERRRLTQTTKSGRTGLRRRNFRTACIVLVLVFSALGVWLFSKTLTVQDELTSVNTLVLQLKDEIAARKGSEARQSLDRIQGHTKEARIAATDPLWLFASTIPWIGSNFSAVSELAESADSISVEAGEPLFETFSLLDSGALSASAGKVDVARLSEASSHILSAANVIESASRRLSAIDQSRLLPEISRPIATASLALEEVRGDLHGVSEFSKILPQMLGSSESRKYLLLIQNNAEVRATGGLPGALAVLTVKDGRVELTGQSSGADLGEFVPPIDVDSEQESIYTTRLGRFISDVNLTPDFPTAARTAATMWETRHAVTIDGVIALDPVVLSHILRASGPISLPQSHELMATSSWPLTLTAENVAQMLLSDAYSRIESNKAQDVFFATAAKQIFEALASGKAPSDKLIQSLVTSMEENRLFVWSRHEEEQRVLNSTGVAGNIMGPQARRTFGVYFNDGTGAKMDYYVKRTVQLFIGCGSDHAAEVRVRVITTNNAPSNAAIALPAAVTGGGHHGVPAGVVQSNIVAYGPAGSHVEAARRNGARISFGAQMHYTRPVATATTRLGPGQTDVVDFYFSTIVQSDYRLLVTPTVHPVSSVVLDAQHGECGSAGR